MAAIDDAFSIANSTTLTAGTGSATATIPTIGGRVPRYIRLVCEGSGNVFIKLFLGAGGSATLNDILVIANEPLILKTNGCDNITYIARTASVPFNVGAIDG